MLQDRKGFMWIGTGDGLNRYDGYQFTVFRHDPADSFSISNNFVLALCEDHHGNLWAGTYNGLNRFDPGTRKFTRFRANPGQAGRLQDKRIWYIYRDRRDQLWIGTATGGLHRFDFASGRFDVYKHDPADPGSISYNGVGVILEDAQGVLWLGTERGGLNRFDRNLQKFKAYRHEPGNSGSLSNDYVWSLLEDRNGTLWVGTYQGGLNRFNRKTETFTRFRHHPEDPASLSGNLVKALLEDEEGRLWVGTYGEGLNLFHPDGESFTRFRHEPFRPQSLGNNYVMVLLQDHSGVMWVGTRYGGISRAGMGSGSNFAVYRRFAQESIGGQGNVNVWAVYEDPAEAGRELWIGTRDGGLFHLNRHSGAVVRYRHDPDDPAGISSNHITAITRDHTGTFWVGTGEGLNRFDPVSGKFHRYLSGKNHPRRLNHNYIADIREDTTGQQQVLWIATRGGGLNRLDVKTGVFRHFRYDTTKIFNAEDYIMQIFPDEYGGERVFWLASYGGGLVRFHPGSKRFFAYRNDPDDPQSLSNDYVLSIRKDQQGTFWVGTGGGLNRFDRENGTFQRFGTQEGLPNSTIYRILGDSTGILWLATNKGIARFDPLKKSFRNYDVRNGLQGNQFTFNKGAYYESPTGELFMGGINGLTAFFPQEITDNDFPPPVVITGLQIFNKPVSVRRSSGPIQPESAEEGYQLSREITESDEIILSYRENVFTFEFAALDYNAPEKNQYAYLLEGFDRDWNYVGNRRTATYTNLDPGEYVFRVKGSNNDGIWNDEGASIRLIITPPWWRTWWAYLLFAGAAGAATFAGLRYELNRQRLKHELEIEHLEAEKLSEIDRMKSRFFANISHEFRTPLTLMKGPIENMLGKTGNEENRRDLQLVRRSCQRLLELINQLLDLSRLESGRMMLKARREEITVMLRGMVMAFESLAELRGLKLTFSAPDAPVFAYVERDKLEKIVSNLLSNAIKFTPEGGEIAVTMAINIPGNSLSKGDAGLLSPFGEEAGGMPRDAEWVELHIADSGIGIPAEQLAHIFDRFHQVDDSTTRAYGGTGIGLALVKELVELHHGEITVSSEVGRGTRFVVRLPRGTAHLRPEEMLDSEQSIPDDGAPETADHQATSGTVRTDPLPAPRRTALKIGQTETDIQNQETALPQRDRPELEVGTGHSETRIQQPVVLVVEDNPDVRRYLCDSLKEQYRTLAANNGKKGLETALRKMPDLIISDVMMPEMNGFVLCEKLKTDERTCHIPVILLTARASDENKLAGLETGADDYLTKPFNAQELRVRIKNLIAQRRRLQQRFQEQLKLEPGEVTVTSTDKRFLQKSIDFIEQHIAEPSLNAELLSSEMAMHRVHLNRKIKALSGLTTTLFIRSIRLKRAAQLLRQHSGNISEIAYEVGFSNPAFFANCFRAQFGMSPSAYLRQSQRE